MGSRGNFRLFQSLVELKDANKRCCRLLSRTFVRREDWQTGQSGLEPALSLLLPVAAWTQILAAVPDSRQTVLFPLHMLSPPTHPLSCPLNAASQTGVQS